MSQLETQFATILSDLTTGMVLDDLTELERRIIATWLVKTGIMANWSANYRRILPDDFPRQLHREQAPPSHVSCFIGRRDLANSVGWCQGNLRFLQMRQTDYETSDTPTSSFVFVIGIMNILLAFSWHAYDADFYTISQAGQKMMEFYPMLRTVHELPAFNSEYEAYLLFQLHPKAAAT
jgi:hypothetical protein